MSSLVLSEFSALSVTSGTYIDTLSRFTSRVRTFDPHRVSEVAAAAVALNLKAWLVYDNYVSREMSQGIRTYCTTDLELRPELPVYDG